MNKSIEALKIIAEEISSLHSTEEKIPLLSRGFELFALETERLHKAYRNLHRQFGKVNRKLEDTNERLKRKVHELHALTDYLDNILSHMSQGLLFINKEGYITTYNKAAEALLEKPKEQVCFQDFQNNFDNSLFGYSMRKALKEKKAPKTTHISLIFADGRQKEIETSSTLIFDGLILLLRDVTEFRRLQILASRKDRMQALGELAAQVAHEIRNPLGGIKGFASLLHRDLRNKPEFLKLTEYIIEGANTLDRLVTQVLNFSRPLQIELKESNLTELLEELKETLIAEKVLKPNIVFTLNAEENVFSVVDAGLLKSAIHNLLINAIQAMPEGGSLNVTLRSHADKAWIQISDTGVGIPEEHLKKLFSPFFSTKPDGNGLGLAETHKLIQAHGGEITVDSLPDYGTCFNIKIPLQI